MIRLFRHAAIILLIASVMAEASREASIQQLAFKVERGDHLATLFNKAKLDLKDLYQILALGKPSEPLRHIYEGQVIKIEHRRSKVLSLRMNYDGNQVLSFERRGDAFIPTLESSNKHRYFHQAHIDIQHSLSSDAKLMVPASISVKAGKLYEERFWPKLMYAKDHVDLLYSDDGQGHGLLLEAMRYQHHKQTFWWVYFTDRHGVSGYFDKDGHSLGMAFDRVPLKYQWISSPFHYQRLHPVLNRFRPHKGVDLAANQGTEVHATADGVITYFGFNGGYGRMVKIKHGPHITTIYAHFSKFAPGLRQGQHVKRHQVIGYVGQSGVATGSHCHYEYRIDQVPYDPMIVPLPTQASLVGHNKELFLDKKWPWVERELLGNPFRASKQK